MIDKTQTHKIEERSFLDHFNNNIMELPKSLWRRAWNWKPLYWLRCHTFTKYHMIDCRTPEYRWGWIDRSEILLLANFRVLVEFIELEKPDKYINWESDPHHSHAWSEMSKLYRWWKFERPLELEALSVMLDAIPHQEWDDMFEKLPDGNGYLLKPAPDEYRKIYDAYGIEEERLEKKDQDNLHRLIEIRRYMWT